MRLIPAVAAALMLAAAPPALARSFAWSFAADILTLDPHSSNNTFTNAFLDNVYETLVRHNPRLELEPSLATRWEVVSPTVWRFHLRENVRFHGGETLRRRGRGVLLAAAEHAGRAGARRAGRRHQGGARRPAR